MIIIVATEEEYALAKSKFKNRQIIKTGVGAINVIGVLQKLDKNVPLLNFGYAGSNTLGVGQEIEVASVELYHPSISYKEPIYTLQDKGVKCYTSCDFVTSTGIKEPCIFDMELAFILALGFNDVKSIKIISDNLSIKQYEENIR